MDEGGGPALDVVKPERKNAIQGNDDTFMACWDQSHDITKVTVTKVNDGVFYLDHALSVSECEELRAAVDNSKALSFWSPQGRENEDVRRFRDADTIEVDGQRIADHLWRRLGTVIEQHTDLSITVTDDAADPEWERELVGHWRPSNFNHDLLFARYPSGGAFAPHTDGRAVHNFNTRSFYSVIVYLNTIPVREGGGTRFYTSDAVKQLAARTNADGKVHWTSDSALSTGEVHPVAGRLLIFHQSLVHEGVPPSSPHQKYIIRSDVMLTRAPAICDSEADREAYRVFKQAEDLAEQGRVDEAVPLFKRALKLSPEMARIMGQA